MIEKTTMSSFELIKFSNSWWSSGPITPFRIGCLHTWRIPPLIAKLTDEVAYNVNMSGRSAAHRINHAIEKLTLRISRAINREIFFRRCNGAQVESTRDGLLLLDVGRLT